SVRRSMLQGLYPVLYSVPEVWPAFSPRHCIPHILVRPHVASTSCARPPRYSSCWEYHHTRTRNSSTPKSVFGFRAEPSCREGPTLGVTVTGPSAGDAAQGKE